MDNSPRSLQLVLSSTQKYCLKNPNALSVFVPNSKEFFSSWVPVLRWTVLYLQCCLPALLHVQMSSLYALVIGEVKPFWEVFFEERPHWLVGGPALQIRHRGGRESTCRTARKGLFDKELSRQIIFHLSYQYKRHMEKYFTYRQVLHQAFVVDCQGGEKKE